MAFKFAATAARLVARQDIGTGEGLIASRAGG